MIWWTLKRIQSEVRAFREEGIFEKEMMGVIGDKGDGNDWDRLLTNHHVC